MRRMKKSEYQAAGKPIALAAGIILFLLLFLGGTVIGAVLIEHKTLPPESGKALSLAAAAIAMFFSAMLTARKEKSGSRLYSVLTILINHILLFGMCLVLKTSETVSLLLPLTICVVSAFTGSMAGKRSVAVRYP